MTAIERPIDALLVEDNPADADLIRELLLEADGRAARLERVPRLAPALERIKAGDVQAVLLDLSLPDSQGLPTLLKIRAASPDLPIVVLTGLDDEMMGVRAVQEGAQDYLIKGQVDGHGLIRAMRYAVERNRVEQKLRESEERLRQSQKMEAIGLLAGGIAHDFNSLLTAVGGFAHLLVDRPESPDRVEWAEQIVLASEHAATLVAQLLAIGRRQVARPEVLSLNTVVTEMGKLLARVVGEDVEIMTVLAPDLGLVMADPGQLGQVLLNLAANARDAMPLGGQLTIETANVEVGEAEAREKNLPGGGEYVTLAVSDTGSGMDEVTLGRIFEPFFTTKEPGKGTGLGLATVYGIVEQSGGAIRVASRLGRGTTFTVYLSRIEGGSREDAGGAPASSLPRGSETVLLVDDELGVRQLAAMVLTSLGYTVLEAESGADALQACRENAGPIDLVLSDVVMARMSGPELVGQLAARYPSARVLYMSGYAANPLVEQGLVDGSIGYLAKPFTPAGLARRVREVLDAR